MNGRSLAVLATISALAAGCVTQPLRTAGAQVTPTAAPTEAFGAAFRSATERYFERSQAAQAVSRQALAGTSSMRDAYESILNVTGTAQAEYGALRPPAEHAADMDRLLTVLDGQAESIEAILAAIDGSGSADTDTEMSRLGALMNEMMDIQSSILGRLEPSPTPP